MQENETIEIIEVSEPEIFNIQLQSAFDPLGEPNELLRHTLLSERDSQDQHPITAITGLRDELDGIKALQTIYSNEKGSADYYEWADGNTSEENRTGYFVSLCDDIRTIKICSGEEVFGVVVDAAAFIGGQDDVPRNYTYGLVTHSGIVRVRCELDVNDGDYVISNDYGVAKKTDSNYGCKVLAISEIDGDRYAMISLDTSIDQFTLIGQDVSSLEGRMDRAESNIISAINVANEAHYLASNLDDVAKLNAETVKKADEALNKANTAISTTERMETSVTQAQTTASQAKIVAENAVASAEAIKTEAVTTANSALANINDLTNELEPITSWTDSESGNTGATYFVDHIQNGLATKVEIESVEKDTELAISATQKNAESLQSLMSSIDKYSVGEYSQAYGLTLEQAQSILKNGMVYIPTVSHSETYTPDFTQEFTQNYSYIWNGARWNEYPASVAFSTLEPIGGGTLQYWYINGDTASEGYESYALYVWADSQWKKVNILDGNVTNRIVSMVRQTTDEVALEVTNSRGSFASLGARINGVASEVQSVASWKSGVEDDVESIATIKQTADDNAADIALVVTSKDGEKVVNAASIVTAVNESDSTVAISAKKVIIDGTTTFINSWSAEEDATCIDGGKIYANSITADQIDATNLKVDAANVTGALTIGQLPSTVAEKSDIPTEEEITTITNNTIQTTNVVAKNLQVNAANITGTFTVKDDKSNTLFSAGDGVVGIGGWSVDDTSLYYGDDLSIFMSAQGIPTNITRLITTQDNLVLKVKDNFGVSDTGRVYAFDGYIGDWIIDSGLRNSYGTVVLSPSGTASSTIGGNTISNLVLKAGNNFGVNINGKVYASDVEITGGSIGSSLTGWKVDPNSIYYGDTFSTATSFLCTGSNASMKIGGSDEISGWTLKAGENFGVTQTGALYCNDAHISGYIYATSGTIGENCSILGTLKANNISSNSLDLINDYDCTYDVESEIYHKASSESTVGDLVIGGYHIVSEAKFASDFPGQTTPTSIPQASLFVGIEPYAFNSYYGPEPVIELKTHGYLFDEEQAPSSKKVTKIRMVGPKGTLHGDWYVANNLISSSSIQITSDYNMKNSIATIPEKYNTFYNNLEPVIYKYNDGTSDRYHSGFIAQPTKDALDAAGLTLKDFAGICIENQGTDEEVWRLRYEEFIALNTWKIQQLEKRIEQMEKKYE